MEHEVRDLAQMRRILKDADPRVDLDFAIDPAIALADAQDIWKLVRAGGGGEGRLTNPLLLARKEKAFQFVSLKITHLRRWRAYLLRKIVELDARLEVLQASINGGGPGLPGGYIDYHFDGENPYIVADQEIQDGEMEEHIGQMVALIDHETVEGAPVAEERALEAGNQLDMTRFNVAYLESKRDGAAVLTAHLAQRIEELEQEFIFGPTDIGAGHAEYPRFEDVRMYSGEAPRV